MEDTEVLRRLAQVTDSRVRVLAFEHRGKRSALGVGIRAATSELVVLVDSDTRWEPGLLAAVQMPFVDPAVGGVGTQQNVYQRRTSVWRRIADWLVNLRYYDYVPAMGRAGAVACLSGRTAAYRRAAIEPVLENLENEFFLGRRCVAGDDGRLTWLVLASGYKTVHQSSARAISMFPSSFRAFVKQRVRWSRNSYRCYLTALYKGWLWRVPLVTKITVLQILLTPVTMGMALGYLLFSRLELTGRGVGPRADLAARGTWHPWLLPPAPASAGDAAAAAARSRRHHDLAADQAVRLRHHEQAGLADPHQRPYRRRGTGLLLPGRRDAGHRVLVAGGAAVMTRHHLPSVRRTLRGAVVLPLAAGLLLASAATSPAADGDGKPQVNAADAENETALVAAEDHRLDQVRAVAAVAPLKGGRVEGSRTGWTPGTATPWSSPSAATPTRSRTCSNWLRRRSSASRTAPTC